MLAASEVAASSPEQREGPGTWWTSCCSWLRHALSSCLMKGRVWPLGLEPLLRIQRATLHSQSFTLSGVAQHSQVCHVQHSASAGKHIYRRCPAQTEYSPALLSGNLPKLSSGDTDNSSLPAVELLSHSSYHASGLQCFPPQIRKHKRWERDHLNRRATRREWKMEDNRKPNVAQP